MRKFNEGVTFEFKKEMNDIELKGIEATLDGIHPRGHEAFGLAYTSTSGYAMYNVLSSVTWDAYEASHLAITEGGTLVMVCVKYDSDGDEDGYTYFGFEQDDIFPEGDDE